VDYAGTSQAAPYVAGAVSLMKALDPALTPRLARALLAASANPSSRCDAPDGTSPDGCGAGLLDVDAALALTAAQALCGQRCSADQMCSAGQCVGIPSVVPRRAAGCGVAGPPTPRSTRFAWTLIGLALAYHRCRRYRRRRHRRARRGLSSADA
jgi:hypothetical protein